jgi:PAS domain S-box-containing protein
MGLRTLEHVVVAVVVGAGVAVGSVTAVAFGFHRSVVLGVIVVVDLCVALALGMVLLDRQRQKLAWERSVATVAKDLSPNSPSSLRAEAECLRRTLGTDGVALLLAEIGQPLAVGAVAGSVPITLRAGAAVQAPRATGKAGRPSGWLTPPEGDPLHASGASNASCQLVPIEGRSGQIVVWSSRPTSRALRQLGTLARVAAESIERSRLDDAEHRSRLGAIQARRHMALLVAASAALVTGFDELQPPLEMLASAIVPEYADYFAVDMVDRSGSVRRVAWRHADLRQTRIADGGSAPVVDLTSRVDALRSHTTIVWPPFPGTDGYEPGPAVRAFHDALGLSSWALVPVHSDANLRALLSIGTVEPRRGLRPSDVATYEELAGRCAMALERVGMYHEAASRERRLQTLFDASPLAIVEVGAGGELRSWNRASADLLGWDDASGAPHLEPGARQVLGALRTRLLAGERVSIERGTLERGREARPVRVSIAASLIPGPDRGSEDDLLCMLTDITQQESMEAALQAQERMESLGRLAGGIAHDFNNLLTVIVGYSEVLADSLGPAHECYGDVAAIREAGERAAAFTEQLLTISRRRVVDREPIDLASTVHSMEPVLRRLVGEDVKFIAHCDAGTGWISLDRSQFEQVLLNLVVNARDAMPSGGSLTVAVEPTTGEDGAEWAVLTVIDTGIGMDAETVKRCFEPFFTTKGLAKGTGLGLATVYSAVDQGGGVVAVETAPSAGTTFRVMFPTLERDGSPATVPTGTVCGALEDGVVLLVEDDDMVRAFARDALDAAGFAVLEAAEGTGALLLAEALEPPCALVADVVMPGMSGPEIAALLPGVPVLYISGYVEDERRQHLLEATPLSRFLAKPFKADDLRDAVREVLSLPQGSNR